MATSLLLLLLLFMLSISHSSQMLLLPLTHSLSITQFNATHHLLKSTSTRSLARFHRHHNHHHRRHQSHQLSLPLSPGSDYTLSFNLGSQPITLYMDTGSDLVWFPCSPFECILCEGKPNPTKPHNLTLSQSHTVSCQSHACSAAHNHVPNSNLCAIARCPLDSIEVRDCSSVTCPPFYYAYADGSLIANLYRRERVNPPSPLILGRYDNAGGEEVEFVYTSMLRNPKHPYFYCVGLVGISVGKKTIPAPEMLKRVDYKGSGGVVVDSGTTFTILPASFYNSVVDEFDNRVGRVHVRASEIEKKTGLGPCYYLDRVSEVPTVSFHFVGNGSSVVLPTRNYFYEFLDGSDGVRRTRKVGCMMLMNGGDETELSGGPGATLGNYQQQGFEVVYDLEKQRVGFARRHCASLWDSINHVKN
ncbi:PREDICTED: probable aspartyl protease At4g16563 isoform X3 [Lupinus angustifolius]|uniref:probable aspartyl protease At4g16563 isoform X3 n=1 Tax=Lupinus angustifolius TaxID=3871 RepID=UPI00092E85B3|nr:PREDICTED: probable aspartyl protease At4g16563 isoform X3 [Lupinus angustifolius]